MNTMLNLDRVWPERAVGYGNEFLASGWVERLNGRLLHGRKVRATIVLSAIEARKVLDWILENDGASYPYSIQSTNQIVGVDLVAEVVLA